MTPKAIPAAQAWVRNATMKGNRTQVIANKLDYKVERSIQQVVAIHITRQLILKLINNIQS